VKLLREKGDQVVVLDNLSSGFRQNLDPFADVILIEGDIRDKAIVAQAVEGCEVIFHLAASVGNTRSIENPILDSEINVIGTLQILEAARKHRVRKIVFSSSAGIFGELKTLPIREDHPVEPDSPYGASKLAAEKLCLAYSKLYDIEAICLRYFNVYGQNQRYDAYGNVIPKFAHLMLHAETLTIYGDGEQTRDFVNVRDVAQANYLAAQVRNVSGAFNTGSATSVTINELVKLMREASNIEPQVTFGPVRKGDVRHSLADISAAKAAFGYDPHVTLEDGLAEYFQWAKQELM
jgi:UDP-glucose 4-epimerase